MSEITVFDWQNPTAASNYQDLDGGNLRGAPLYWQTDVSGKMQKIIFSYLERRCNPGQLRILIAYLQHYIHAPMWLDHDLGPISESIERQIAAIRRQSMAMATIADVDSCINAMVKLGLDPL